MCGRIRACTHTHSEGWWIPMPLTDRVDWFRMVAASCRREKQLFLDQGVAGRERLRKALSVRVCKEYCSLERSFLLAYKHMHTRGFMQLWLSTAKVYSMFLHPRLLFLFFACLPPPFSSSLSVCVVSSSPPELTWCANVSTFRFICQSPELRPASCVYLSLHKGAPSAVPCFYHPPV